MRTIRGEETRVDFRVADGKIVCAGKDYKQFIIRNLLVEGSELVAIHSFNNEFVNLNEKGAPFKNLGFVNTTPINHRAFDPPKARTQNQINGKASIIDDALSVIGSPELKTKQLKLQLSEAQETDENSVHYVWKAGFFFFPFDWEIGREDEWSLSVCIPSKTFREIAAGLAEGHNEKISISMDTDLWTEAGDEHRPPSSAVVWYLAPDKDGRKDSMPETARGVVTSFSLSSERPTGTEKPTAEDKSKPQVGIKQLVISIYFVAGAIFLHALMTNWR